MSTKRAPDHRVLVVFVRSKLGMGVDIEEERWYRLRHKDLSKIKRRGGRAWQRAAIPSPSTSDKLKF